MTRMSRRWFPSGLAAILAVSMWSTGAFASDRQVTVPEAALAARAAIAYVGGQWATIVRPGAPGVAWQFRVLRRDRSVTDVLLNEHLELVDVGDLPNFATGYRAPSSSTAIRSGSSTIRLAHTARDPSHSTSRSAGFIPQADYAKAAKAALNATGGGRVIHVEIDREGGAMYEVEVIITGRRPVDVLLDSNFKLIETSSETDSGEPAKPGRHRRDDDRN